MLFSHDAHSGGVVMSRGCSKPILYKNVWYKSHSALARETGVSQSTISAGLRDGRTIDDIIESARKSVNNSLVRRVADKPVSGSAFSLVYKDKEYASLTELCQEYCKDQSVVTRRLGNGWSLQRAIETPVKVRRSSSELRTLDFPGCSTKQLANIQKRCNNDIELCRLWLTRIFLESPTEFHGDVFRSVKDACEHLNVASIATIRSKMLQLVLFQDAVHSVYWFFLDKLYCTEEELLCDCSIPGWLWQKAKAGVSSHDEALNRVSEMLKFKDRLEVDYSVVARRISRTNKFVSGTVVCGDGNYLVYCAECGRPLYLPEAAALSFEHSEKFCERNTQRDLYKRKSG